MRIILYKAPQNYITHDFKQEDLLDILDIVNELGIKYYVLVY